MFRLELSVNLTLIFTSTGDISYHTHHKRTSGTTLFREDGVTVVAQKDADLSNISFEVMSGDRNGMTEKWTHHVADPLCGVAPAIDYEMMVTGYSNGNYRFVGSHDQAPSYEFRIGAGGQWYNIHTFNSRGLQYLLPIFPQGHVDVSGDVG